MLISGLLDNQLLITIIDYNIKIIKTDSIFVGLFENKTMF